MRQTISVTLLLAFAVALHAASPRIAGCPVLPDDNIWNARVDRLPVDPNSAGYVAGIGATKPLHADFGAGLYQDAPIGIPFVTVPGSQPKASVTFQYADESDAGPYPIPSGVPIEGGPGAKGDRHVLVVDRDACVLYELFAAYPNADGSWRAGSGAIFNLRSNALRTATWTSADAAGLPIMPGLARYDEAAGGEIRHALRFTAPATRRAYIWPATHFASSSNDPQLPPMGQRFRLKADYNIAGFPPQAQVILTALKRYGMFLADNGSPWFISGAPDDHWNNDALGLLRQVHGSDFEAVDESSLLVNRDSGQAKPQKAVIDAVVNAASYLAGPAAPGEWVTAFGAGLGSHVLLNGVAADAVGPSSAQVSFALPDSLSGSTVLLEVEDSDPLEIPVTAAAPALFAADSSGRGQAAALNQDGNLNSAANPAPTGSLVRLFGTGAAAPLAAVTANIGDVLSATSVHGVLQVDLRLSADSGTQPLVLTVVLTVSQQTTQPGITLAVK